VITKFSRYPNHGLIKEGEMHEAYSDKINTLKEKGIISKKFFVPKLIDYSDSLLIMKKAN
jgi:hypothetical protein